MEEYQKRLYDGYYERHVLPRKGKVSKKLFEKKMVKFDMYFSFALPEDKEAKILDAGCGNGSLIYWLHNRGYKNAFGVDASGDQISAGQSLGIDNLIVGNLFTTLIEADGSYDVIFLRDVAEHFSKKDVLPLLDACYKALKVGGKLVLQVPNGASPFVGRVLYGDFTHETAYTESSLSQIMYTTGYDNLVFKPFAPYFPKLKISMLFNKKMRQVMYKKLAWSIVSRIYYYMLYAELGSHKVITTFNIIAAGDKRKEV